jgi:hypothetical protein
VTITGTNFTDATAVSFGAGITVTFTVSSSTQITATIVIDPGATTGARDVSVTTPGGAGTVAGMFTVTQSRQFIGSGPHGGNTGTSGLPGQQGTIGLPNIIVQSASISTASPAPGQAVTITANVANRGTTNGTTAVRVYVNGQEEAAQGVTLNSGSNKSIYFTISRSEPGAYMVYVGGTPAGSFTVGQAAGPDIILAISSLLVLAALVLSLVYVSRRRQRYYR